MSAVRHGGLDTPEYLTMNPNRLIPVVADGGTVIWESNAILRYLAASHGAGTLWPEDPGARSAADRWMDWAADDRAAGHAAGVWGLIRTAPERSGTWPRSRPAPSGSPRR